MKFWELYSVLHRRGADLPRGPRWHRYREWWDASDQLIRDQDRGVLDHEMPDDLVLEALAVVAEPYFLEEGVLRARPIGASFERLTAVEVARRYDGAALEQVQEFGSLDVIARN